MEDREDENLAEEQANALEQEEGQAELIDGNLLLQEHPQPLVQEDAHDTESQQLAQAEQAILRQRPTSASSNSSTSRQFAPSNLSFAMAHSSNNNNNNPQRDGDDNRHHHPRQGSPPRMQRLNEAAAVERTSIPEQHNDLLLPESDDDSQCPMAASWSTVTTYGGIPPSERSRKLIGLSYLRVAPLHELNSFVFLHHYCPQSTPRQF